MYTWIWEHLPGPTAMRLLEALVLIVAVTALLFGIVFPWIDHYLQLDNGAMS